MDLDILNFFKCEKNITNPLYFCLSFNKIIEKMSRQTRRQNKRIFKKLCLCLNKQNEVLLGFIISLLFDPMCSTDFCAKGESLRIHYSDDCYSSFYFSIIFKDIFRYEYGYIFKKIIKSTVDKLEEYKLQDNWFTEEIINIIDERTSYEYSDLADSDDSDDSDEQESDYDYEEPPDPANIDNTHLYYTYAWAINKKEVIHGYTHTDSWGNNYGDFPAAVFYFTESSVAY